MDKEDAFWIGNVIGVVALGATVLIAAPYKERERKEYEAKQRAIAAAAMQPQPIVSAAKLIKAGEKIKATSLGTTPIINKLITSQMLRKPEEAVGRWALHEMKAGTVISSSDLQVSPPAVAEKKGAVNQESKDAEQSGSAKAETQKDGKKQGDATSADQKVNEQSSSKITKLTEVKER
ncbi:MAG: SAF domain-containing protein [Terriglobales bacterium]